MSNQFTYSVPFTADQLREDYHGRRMSQSEIGAKWGVSQKVVWRAMSRLGIDRRRSGPRDARRYGLAEFHASYLPEPNTGCWLWHEAVNGDGYGVTRIDGKGYGAHRAAMLYSGWNIEGRCVLHRCDTPACVNPDHLFLGTQTENIADMVRKNRQAALTGIKNPRAKLTEEQVLEIRAASCTGAELGRRFGVSKEMIYHIKAGRSWSHLEVKS